MIIPKIASTSDQGLHPSMTTSQTWATGRENGVMDRNNDYWCRAKNLSAIMYKKYSLHLCCPFNTHRQHTHTLVLVQGPSFFPSSPS